MTRNDLILRIGSDDGPLRAALKKLNNDLVRAGNKLESVGQSLSLRLSVPIAAAGVASVKAFADFEKLEKSISAVSGSAGEAEATLSRLRKLALQPGIDLQNAVTASVRLQAVGLEAERAEDLILQFSKAVTLAGGTGEDLGEVVRQISQIISKGKVLSSDFRVIQERVPAIGIALNNAFGTSNIEAIREAGVSADDFIKRLTDGIRVGKEFQNVQGGLSNSINNFQQAIQASLVTLGRSISESINLDEVLDNIATTISRLTDGFAALSPETKRTILTIAGVTAAIGPLLIGIGAVLKVLPLLRLGFATLLGPIGLISIAIGALAAEFLAYKLEASAAEKAQEAVNDALSEAAERTEEEKQKVSDLIGVIESETESKGRKAEAIEQLKRISPEYFGGLDIEKTKTEDLIVASENFNRSLQTRNELQEINAKSAAAQEELVKVQERLALASAEAQRQAGGQFGVYAGGANEAGGQVRELQKRTEELQAQIEGFASSAQKITTDFATAPTAAATSSGTASISGAGQPGPQQLAAFSPLAQDAERQIRILNAAIVETGQIASNAFSAGLNADFEEFKGRIETVTPLLATFGEQFENLALKNQFLGDKFTLLQEQISLTRQSLETAIFEGTSTEVEFLSEKLSQLATEYEKVNAAQSLIEEGTKAASSAFSAAADSQEKGLAGIGKAAKKAAREFIKAQLAQAVAVQATKAISTLGILGIPLAIAGAAAVGGLFNTIIPALAQGGIATAPTLALIGEGRESEAIIPLSKLNTLIDSNSGGSQELTARLSGEDLLLLIRRVENAENRIG